VFRICAHADPDPDLALNPPLVPVPDSGCRHMTLNFRTKIFLTQLAEKCKKNWFGHCPTQESHINADPDPLVLMYKVVLMISV
jgi:hypothetical protein